MANLVKLFKKEDLLKMRVSPERGAETPSRTMGTSSNMLFTRHNFSIQLCASHFIDTEKQMNLTKNQSFDYIIAQLLHTDEQDLSNT